MSLSLGKMPFQCELFVITSVSGSNDQLLSSTLSPTLLTRVSALCLESIESNNLDKLSLGQYIGCDNAHTFPMLRLRGIPAYLSFQSLINLAATIEAIAITVICGLTPTEVGKTLASQTKRFLNPWTLQSESTTESAPILLPDWG